MKKSEFEEKISREFGLNFSESRKVVDTIVNSMSDTLGEGGGIEIRGFGSLYTKSYMPYEGRNPRTGDKISVAAKILPMFKVSRLLLSSLSEKPDEE